MPEKIKRTLKIKMSGDDVKSLQKTLSSFGFPVKDDPGKFGKGTKSAVQEMQKRFGKKITGIADQKFFDKFKNLPLVTGEVTQPNGNPIVGARVRIIDRKLGAKDGGVLGEVATDTEGRYDIKYLVEGKADLLVQILDKKGVVVTTSPLIIEATDKQTVDLAVDHKAYPDLPEYAILLQHLKPFLNGTKPVELNNEGVTYLAGKTQINPVNIAYLVNAHRLSKKTGLDAEIFYGMFRSQLPVNLPALAVQDKETHKRAIEDAVAANIVTPKVAKQLDKVLAKFATQKVDQLLKTPEMPVGSTSMGGLLKVAGITEDQKRTFVTTFANHDATHDAFFDDLAKSGFDTRATDRVKLAMQLGSLSQNHAPLMESLHKQLSSASAGLRSLVGRSEADWLKDIRKHKDKNGDIALPPDLPVIEGKSPEQVYARNMMRVMEVTFPTATLISGLDKVVFSGSKEIKSFIAKNNFEFRDTNLRGFMREKKIKLPVKEREDLFAFKRIFDITPSLDRQKSMEPLLRDGVKSAHAIRKMGEGEFKRRYGAEMGKTTTKEVYQAASQKSAMATAKYAAHSSAMNNLGMRVIPKDDPKEILIKLQAEGEASGIDLPAWESLFGSLTFCACEHCRSVYSPAAYLVDLLSFLEGQKTNGDSAKDILFKRRGDIGKIELNCHNTNTTLPYIDLVNEVLEHYFAQTQGSPNLEWWNEKDVPQTVGDREHLRVHPENITETAYTHLKKKIYPWSLPFDMWAAEMRTYLEPLDVKREEIMLSLNAAPEDQLPEEARNNIAVEHLGLFVAEFKTIFGNTNSGAKAWGGVTENNLRQVRTLMKRGRLTYSEVRQLLDTKTVNGDGEMVIEFSGGDSTNESSDVDLCDLDNASIPALQLSSHAESMQRFMRLKRRLGWEIHELDVAVGTLSGGSFNTEFLRLLSVVKQLHDFSKAPLLTILSWWSDIDTTRPKDENNEEQPSLYDKLFLNKTVGNDEDVQIFALNAKRNELADESKRIDEVKAALLAAFNFITAEELDLIIKKRPIDDNLNLANLSELHRVASLARTLRLSVRDLLTLIDLTGFDPFDLTTLEDMPRLFLGVLERIRTSGFSIDELAYLVSHDFEPDSVFASVNETTSDFLFRLRNGLKKIKQTYQLTPDSNGEPPEKPPVPPISISELTAKHLAQVLPEKVLPQAMIVIAGVSDSDLPGAGLPTVDRNAIVDTHFKLFIDDLQTVKDKLLDETLTDYLTPGKKQTERFQEILKPLLAFLKKSNNVTLVKQSFAEFLDVDLRTSDLLMGGLVKAISDTTLPASAEFLEDTFISSHQKKLTEKDFPILFQLVLRLKKIATLLKIFNIPSEELRWLVEEGSNFGWLNLNALPVNNLPQNLAENSARFNAWLRMAEFTWLRKNLPANDPSLFALIRMAHSGADEEGNPLSQSEFIDHLQAGTGWNEKNITTLLDKDHFNLAFNNDFTNENALKQLLRLHRSVGILKHLGVSVEMAWGWTIPNLNRGLATEVKQAGRAKFEENEWLSVAKPIRDGLRRQQRTALMDGTLEIVKGTQNPDKAFESPEDLFGFFLMDIEMNPCMQTSRIKQAISSVQLFIQRCLMNLEEEVTFNTDATDQWKWMKNYRVWEANRKIFLYPENWIEPELRPGKSPFFEDLENELLQNDVTKETAELAFLTYLEKLDEVARLEVACTYKDEETKTFHVLGRTKAIPHKYFYRRWEKQRHWTPWETVPIDIEGENVAMTLFNRRLYLFWFMTQEKADTSDNPPMKYLEIKLAWSQYRTDKWSPKKLSDVVVQTLSTTDTISPKIIAPRPFTQDSTGDFNIAVEWIGNSYSTPLRTSYLSFKHADKSLSIPDAEFYFLHFEKKGDFIFKFNNEEQVSIAQDEKQKFLPLPTKTHLQWSDKIELPRIGPLFIRIKDKTYLEVLQKAGPYRIVVPVQYLDFRSQAPLIYEDSARSYLIFPRPWYVPGWKIEDIRDTDLVKWGWALSEPDEPRRPPLGNPGVFRGVSAIGRTSRLENVLEARNVHGRDRTDGNAFNRGGDLLLNRRTATASVSALSIAGNDGQPFVMDDNLLFEADRLLNVGSDDSSIFTAKFSSTRYQFLNFYHPYVGFLISQLNRLGIDGLLNPIEDKNDEDEADGLRRQQKQEGPDEVFKEVYELGSSADDINVPVEEFDFKYTGTYASYNWELFFHAPLLIATRLSANQQFEEAQKWFHYIFDPTNVDTFEDPEDQKYRYWKVKPFFENRGLENIRKLLRLFSSGDSQAQAEQAGFDAQIADWRKNAFQPHLIAQQRIVAYQKATVMKYIDNLIAWADQLFSRDSIESINEATQLYVLAAQILGKRPELVPAPDGKTTIDNNSVKTFNDLEEHLDSFGNALIQIETEQPSPTELHDVPNGEASVADILGSALFFCIPMNDKLLGYWDTVADRLFKIRNCMNIEGVVRQLKLFEPPIDPALLVRATAAGIDVNSVLNDMNAPRLNYRYGVLVQKAIELCSDVKQLGGALLAALEKRDAEALTLLRSEHEGRLLKATKGIRELQVTESEKALEGLQKNLESAKARQSFYAERESRIPNEKLQLDKLDVANSNEEEAQEGTLYKAEMSQYPQLDFGYSGLGGHGTVSFGSMQLASRADAAIQESTLVALLARSVSNRASIVGGFDRRQEEWDFQAEQAKTEIEALEKQIEGAHLRIEIAKHERNNLAIQIEQNRETDEFMRTKFTNKELYSWTISQVSTIYFQSYQLAYDMAKRAQRAYQYEMADFTTTFIDFGYWDSLKKGLLAGEQLHYDLQRMGSAYLETNRREYELTKHISLSQLNPVALVQLKETGTCEIDIPEVLFDLDYPGHFLRRIKSVGITIPCVTGPYTTVNCTLTLLNNRVRLSTDDPSPYTGLEDNRFISDAGGVQSIATSNAREDSGLFEFNFRDERYLPFEGNGVVGRWRLELPSEYRQFDYNTISDAVLHMRYTAREGDIGFKEAVGKQIDSAVNEIVDAVGETGMSHFISMKHEFGTAFHRFLNPVGAGEHQATLTISKQQFPFLFQSKSINIKNVILFVKLRDTNTYDNKNPLTIAISRNNRESEPPPLKVAEPGLPANLAQGTYGELSGFITDDEDWVFTSHTQKLSDNLKHTVDIEGISVERINTEEVEDFGIFLQYEIS
jgi:peptidoglycan hydrolase-like protein with peptidoglycan-binding domain